MSSKTIELFENMKEEDNKKAISRIKENIVYLIEVGVMIISVYVVMYGIVILYPR
jgi:hypothetical protein